MKVAKSLKRQRIHQPTPFQIKKEIRRGEISEKGKGGGWRGASAFSADRRGGSALQIFSEIGSDFGVKSHQFGTETEIVALWGDFFACGA
ncbi:hypothetical protein KBD87_03330 [Candidatus Saccharibacteria bacterium]|nr:hypothetical protein [Candidatus Saccharibacteria bacterium]